MNNFAPVFIFTLNRYEHFKRCVESLSNCTHADKTELYIALDYPANETHWEGYKKINSFLPKIRGFKEVIIFRRDENFGAIKNELDGQKEIFRKHDRIITSEDDNEFSPNFLDYINKGLDKFEDDDNVLAICGYNYPIEIPKSYNADIYIWKGFSGWGYGVWRDKVNKVYFSIEEVNEFLNKISNIKKLNKYAGHYLPSLLNIIKTKHITGDTEVCMYLIKNNMYCVFPVLSKVRNFGHDGSGEHCGTMIDSIYAKQEIDNNNQFKYISKSVKENKEINKALRQFFRQSWKGNAKSALNYIKFIAKSYLLQKK